MAFLQKTLLLCGDTFELKESSKKNFQSLPFRLLPASNFSSALKWLQTPYTIDLIICNAMAFGKEFYKDFEKFRKKPEVFGIPVLLLTQEAQLEDLEKTLNFCDDFILDHASREEVSQRIQRLLKMKPIKKDKSNSQISIGALKVSLNNFQAFKNGTELKLTPLEFKLIHYLYKNKSRLLKREELLREVWGYKDLMQTRTIDTYMKRLRAKLGTEGKFIETIRGLGYRLKI